MANALGKSMHTDWVELGCQFLLSLLFCLCVAPRRSVGRRPAEDQTAALSLPTVAGTTVALATLPAGDISTAPQLATSDEDQTAALEVTPDDESHHEMGLTYNKDLIVTSVYVGYKSRKKTEFF